MDKYVRVSASSDWKDMAANWQVGFAVPDETIGLELYTNAVFDLVAVLLAKVGQEFTKASLLPAPPTPADIFTRINTISAAITSA